MADETLPTPRRALTTNESPIDHLDTNVFEQMMRVAKVMGHMSLIPDHLKVRIDDQGRILKAAQDTAGPVRIDYEGTIANCFMIVNIATAWKVDPFRLAQVSYQQAGRIGFEGKHAFYEVLRGLHE